MSETEIPVGRELDKAVALRVLGWTWEPCEMPEGWPYPPSIESWRLTMGKGYSFTLPGCGIDANGEWQEHMDLAHLDELPPFSTDIAAAWQIVEHLKAQGWGWDAYAAARWVQASFSKEREHLSYEWGGEAGLPEAICRAALALGEAQEREGGQP